MFNLEDVFSKLLSRYQINPQLVMSQLADVIKRIQSEQALNVALGNENRRLLQENLIILQKILVLQTLQTQTVIVPETLIQELSYVRDRDNES